MTLKSILGAIALLTTGFVSVCAEAVNAAEIKVLGSVGLKSVLEAVLPDFERVSGHKVTTLLGTASAMKAKIDGGEVFDVVVLLPAQVDDLVKQGKAANDTRIEIARAGPGLGIRAGAMKPDLSNDEKLKTFLLGVKSISHGDPALGGFAAVYFVKLATALGIAEDLKSKTIYSKPGEGATLVANGQVDLGVGMMSEVVPVSGVQAISLKPEDASSFIVFAGAVASATKDADASRALLTFMRSTAVKEVIRTQGMTTP